MWSVSGDVHEDVAVLGLSTFTVIHFESSTENHLHLCWAVREEEEGGEEENRRYISSSFSK